MALPNPVVVVPGITASALRDEYSLPPDTVWSMSILSNRKEYERIALHPDNLRYETIEPARVVSDHVLEVAYSELIEELRHNLRNTEDQPVPVFAFSYDWRQPLIWTESQLAVFVEEVIARTRLLRHYQNEVGADAWIRNPRVNLVGHSMGGLVITGYLARQQGKAPVAKVATLAAPFRGSFESVVQVSTGTANLGTGAPSSRERETARVTPALYHLLPTCPGLTVDGTPNDAALFDYNLWQPSIVESLQEYVRLYAAHPDNAKAQAEALLRQLLTLAETHNAVVQTFRLEDAGLGPDDWLCVVGADSDTRVALNIATDGGIRFNFQDSDRKNEWKSGDEVQSDLTGDGTVPYEGARPAFIAPERLVCVTPDDYGYWEIQDRLTTKVAGFHGILPNMDMLHRLLVRFFTGRPDPHGNTWGRPAPGVTAADWNPPLALTRKNN